MAFPSPIDSTGSSISETMDDVDDKSDNTSILDDDLPKPGEPAFFDLRPPQSNASHVRIEDLVKRLFSHEHLHFIIADQTFFYRFCIFVNRYKPHLAPTLVRYLEMRKVMRTIEYANSVARKIRWSTHTDHYKFSRLPAAAMDLRFEDYANKELKLLCSEVLPAFITHSLTNFVVDCVARDITGESVPVMQDLVGNLAEIFCLTDPSLPDNPIIYASEEFHRTTQYGTTYAIDRNCRFLQGPGTDSGVTTRLREAISQGKEVCETILNYRRDGSPFVNLLMCAPLFDDKGQVRYFIGAQVDVSGLVEEGRGIESFRTLLQTDKESSDMTAAQSPLANGSNNGEMSGQVIGNGYVNVHVHESGNIGTSIHTNAHSNGILNGNGVVKENGKVKSAARTEAAKNQDMLDRLRDLSMMFSQDETEIVTKYSREGRATDDYGFSNTAEPSADGCSISEGRSGQRTRGQGKRVIGSDTGTGGFDLTHLSLHNTFPAPSLPGVYKNYILTHPFPSLRILFVSPSLRIPGLLRTPLFTKLGGSHSTLSSLSAAFRDGAPSTAKILWLPKSSASTPYYHADPNDRSRQRWIRATPLLGSDDKVGVWMIILVPVVEANARYDLGGGHASDIIKNGNVLAEMQRASRPHSRSSTRTTGSVRGMVPERIVDDCGESGDAIGVGYKRNAWIMKNGRGQGEKGKDMYAEYLRNESTVEEVPQLGVGTAISMPVRHRAASVAPPSARSPAVLHDGRLEGI